MRDGDPFPGYDVLRKRTSLSWNDKTRAVVDARMSAPIAPKFFTREEFTTVEALAARIVPQPPNRLAIPVATLVDDKLHKDKSDGYRRAGMPKEREAWRQAIIAIDAESDAAHGRPFRDLPSDEQDRLLRAMHSGELTSQAWKGVSSKTYFETRIARDLVFAYFAHPSAWSMIGWGGPASPRGYVRMDYDERDPWEAAEVKDGDIETALRKNRHV